MRASLSPLGRPLGRAASYRTLGAGTVWYAGFVGLAMLTGCQGEDLGRLDQRSALHAGEPAFEGRFETRIADMFDGTSKTMHMLVDGPNEVEIRVADPTALTRDAVVRVYGDRADDGVLEVEHFEVVSLPPLPAIDADPFAPRNLATILVFWGETPGLTNGLARQSMFTGEDATSVFYGENSYGRERVVGDVFGPYQIQDPGSCNPSLISDLALAAMQDKGHNPYDYQQILYQFPSISGCGWAGLASVGSPQAPARDSWYNGSFGCVVRNQEVGHNYGMGHSHSYNCPVDEEGNDLILDESCEHVEYGDPYDPMGGGCAHINVVQKTYMGWVDGCNIVTTEANGTFNLLPLELPCNGTQGLRFPAYDGRYYWLEYRLPIGEFDGGLDGVLLHVSEEVEGFGGPAPYILDVGDNGFLRAGDSYTDPEGAVTFSVVETNPTHAVIEVTFPDGGSGTPSCLGGGQPETVDGAVGSLECSETPYPADDVGPTVEITFPQDGQVFAPGSDFAITAEAADDRLITELELYIDGEPMFKDFEPPWEWDVNNIPEGEYEFGVVARDGRNVTPSNAVAIDVSVEGPAADSSGGEEPDGSEGPAEGTGAGEASDESGDTDGEDADQDGSGAADEGCGCRQSGSDPMALGLLVLGIGLISRRRRMG